MDLNSGQWNETGELAPLFPILTPFVGSSDVPCAGQQIMKILNTLRVPDSGSPQEEIIEWSLPSEVLSVGRDRSLGPRSGATRKAAQVSPQQWETATPVHPRAVAEASQPHLEDLAGQRSQAAQPLWLLAAG